MAIRAPERWAPERPCPFPGHPHDDDGDDERLLVAASPWQRFKSWVMAAPAERLPLPAIVTTWPAAEIMHVAHISGYVPGCATCAATAAAWLTWFWHRKKSPHPRLAPFEAAGVTAAAGAWITAADMWAPYGWPDHLLSFIYAAGSIGGYWWLRRHEAVIAARKRREDAAAEIAFKKQWHQILHRAGLGGWHVQQRSDTNLGYEVLITTSPENASAKQIAANSSRITEKLEHILGLPYNRVDANATGLPGELIIGVRTVDVSSRSAAYHPMTMPWPESDPSPFLDWFPKTASIRDPAVWGFCPEDSSPLYAQLFSDIGGRVLGVFGMTGSGKSTVLNDLREFVTRCPDARLLQLNGAHMGDELTWQPLSALTRCGPVATNENVRNDIAEILAALCLLVTERSATLAETGHSTFQPTPDKPALVIFIDEVDEIVAHVPGAGQALEFLASKQRKSAIALVLSTQRAVIKSIGGGAVRANMSEALVGKVARDSESRHATGADAQLPDIREYSGGAPGYFQTFDPHSGTVTGRGRAFLLGVPPEELAYIKSLVASRVNLRDWRLPDMPDMDLDGGEAAAEAADAETTQEVTGLRARLAAARGNAAAQPEPATPAPSKSEPPAPTAATPFVLGVPPTAVAQLMQMMSDEGRVSAASAGLALGVSKTVAYQYLAAMLDRGLVELDKRGRASGWYLARPAAPEPASPDADAAVDEIPPADRPDGYQTLADLARAVHEGEVDVDDEAREVLARAWAIEQGDEQ